MEGCSKKRVREDQHEDSAKQMRLDGFALPDSQAEEKSGTSPEFCDSFGSEYSLLLNDPWSWSWAGEDQVAGSSIGSSAIRKNFMEPRCESTVKESVPEAQGGCAFFEDELWRPPSPPCGIEALFSQDFEAGAGSSLGEDSFLPCAASGFRIWEEEEVEEEEERRKDGKAEGIRFLRDGEVSDWILRAPLDQPLLPESLEFEISVPNV